MSMPDSLKVHPSLFAFVNDEVMPGTGVQADGFWKGLATLLAQFAPRNAALLRTRDDLQAQIDEWHRQHPGAEFDAGDYRRFLDEIGYLLPEGSPFKITTANVDPEIARIAGPQLVVPVSNARYALNAANARWGSLYDALYGTDAIAEDGAPRGRVFNPARGNRVVAFARRFLDQHFPLVGAAHADVVQYGTAATGLSAELKDGRTVLLQEPAKYRGYQGDSHAPSVLLLCNHGLHVEIHIDRTHFIGRDDPAGMADLILESAITTIQDCEDSVTAVDAADKVGVYRNWLGLMRGDLEAHVDKTGAGFVRRLGPDRHYQTGTGAELVLPGRSVMLVRNVGMHMLSDIVTLDGLPVPETIIDCAITALSAMHDIKGTSAQHNSRTGSVYIVKPKMHGPAEAAFACELFGAVETLLGLPANVLKIGIMDEERRTTVNLAECIRAASARVVFINTGFLDRTGDEIHTSMEAAAVPRKAEMRKARWLDAYELQNVDIGLACGLRGHAQIGKGMWAMPDLMADMLRSKIEHPRAGASTSWVPSPTAATLHALHYHEVDVAEVQRQLASRPRAALADILTPPLIGVPGWSATEILEEVNNNVQSILGYVVRWVDEGVGCSKVPDYYDTALMEDRATLRISAQHVANWLHHGVCSRDQVLQALGQMAAKVDLQNSDVPGYGKLVDDSLHNPAFQAACDLIFKGREEPNGYTEGVLTRWRQAKKALAVR